LDELVRLDHRNESLHPLACRHRPLLAGTPEMADDTREHDRHPSGVHRMTRLPAGITPPGTGKANPSEDVKWSILGHTYWLKAQSEDCFAFETLDPPGTYVPPHVHPTQDEFIYMLEGTFDLYLDGSWSKAGPGALVRMPRGMPHGYYNRGDVQARALFWVTPARRLRALFDQLHNLGDVEEVVRRSA